MKIITLNLNGIRSACRKGFLEWIQLQQPDYICLQELKAQEADLSLEILKPEGYEGFFSYAQKKGYSGVGIYSKNTPLRYKTNTGILSIDDEGRYIELNFKNFSILSLYLPSGSSGDERQNFKYNVLDDMKTILDDKLNQNKYVVVCGDFNIAHQEIDLKNYKGNRKNSGFLPQERDWLTKLYQKGWEDVYRKLYPDSTDECYTWWSNRGKAWLKNVGWRIDYQIANQALASKAINCQIFKEQRFSDHAPLIINYEELG
tara:strand:- start:1224 stop:2000 length:777 start_codon:yes stop_codon:yes gene_type:complete